MALWMSPLDATLLYGLEPNDPLTMGVTIGPLGATDLLAAAIPAWRAARVNPPLVLRGS